MSPDQIISFFAEYAYQPNFVYGFVVLFMTASSFGLPIPEEVTLISVGLVAYMARNPEIYPPPYEGAVGVNLYLLCVVCFFAVLGSDLFIYFLGKFFGNKLMQTKFFKKQVSGNRFDKINQAFHKYSYWVCGFFRFTPGLRFPGHMSCGMMGIPVWKFALVDGLAALISVPTQVIMVALYGDIIIGRLKEFKLIIGIIILVLVIIYLVKRFLIKPKKVPSVE